MIQQLSQAKKKKNRDLKTNRDCATQVYSDRVYAELS